MTTVIDVTTNVRNAARVTRKYRHVLIDFLKSFALFATRGTLVETPEIGNYGFCALRFSHHASRGNGRIVESNRYSRRLRFA